MSSLSDPLLVSGENCVGDAGNDSFKLQATGKGVSENSDVAVNANSVLAGDGNNKADLSAKHSGNAYVLFNDILGGADVDKIKLSTTSKSENAAIFQNMAELGEGKDSLQITAKTGVGNANVSFNGFDMGNGGSSVKLSVQNKGATFETGVPVSDNAGIINNEITAGDGTNKFDFSAKSVMGSAMIGVQGHRNSIVSGDDKDTLKFSATNKGEAFTRYDNYDVDSGQDLRTDYASYAQVGFNSVISGGGDDQVTMKTKSGIGQSMIGYNTIVGASGKSKLSLTAQNKGSLAVYEFSEYVNTSASFEVFDYHFTHNAVIQGNSILTGSEDDSIILSAKSSNGEAIVGASRLTDGNTIYAGYGDDTIKLSAQAGSGSMVTIATPFGPEDLLYGGARVNGNRILSVDGDNEFSLSANGGKSFATMHDNELISSYGRDEISLSLKGDDTYANGNLINASSGEDEISLELKGMSYVSSSENTLMGGDDNDVIDIELTSKSSTTFGGRVYVVNTAGGGDYEELGNSVLGGGGEDNIEISLKSTSKMSAAFFAYNTISGGEDDDTVKIKVSAKGAGGHYSGRNFSENILYGDGGEDLFELDLKTSLGDGEIQQFFNYSVINGGDGDNDTVLIGSKNQEIDLTTVAPGNLMNLEKIDLGKSKSNLILDDTSVQDITDGDDLLLISGKGSVDFGMGASYLNAANGYTYFDLGSSIIGLGDKIDFVEPTVI